MKENLVPLGITDKRRSEVEHREPLTLPQVSNAKIRIEEMRDSKVAFEGASNCGIRVDLGSIAQGDHHKLCAFFLDLVAHHDKERLGDLPGFLPGRITWLKVDCRIQAGLRIPIPRCRVRTSDSGI